MTADDLEKKFVKFLSRRKKSDGELYAPTYAKDKVSRLRKLFQILPLEKLTNINDSNFFEISEVVMRKFNQPIANNIYQHQYKDYLVVIRLLYEMNNFGKKAKRYAYYGGKKI